MWSEPTIVYTPTREEEKYNYLQQEMTWCIENENYERCIGIKKEMEELQHEFNR